MKSKIGRLPCVIFMSLSVVGLVSGGCNRHQDSGAGAGRRYKVGFANIAEDFPFPVRVREGIVAAAKAAGNIDLVVADNKMDGATALANAQNFLTQNVDGVIEFQTDEKFGATIMSNFQTANVPVIAIDIPMPGATFFGVNNYPAGRMAGEGLAKWVKANWDGKIDALIMLELPQSGPIPAARLRGEREGLEAVIGNIDETKVKHLDSKNTLEKARDLIADTLTTLPDAHHIAVVCINDDTALGALAAAEAAGRKNDLAVVAVGADDRAREEMRRSGSRLVGSTSSSPEKYGEKIIPTLLKMMNHQTVPSAVYIDHVFITRENVDQYYPNDKK